jgi:hypothetical protein
MRVDLYEEQPDVGGNRHYDYISVEEHDAAEKTLETKEEYKDLTSHEIVVLRSRLKSLGILPDLVDHKDRLALLRCLIITIENREAWYKKYHELKAKGDAGVVPTAEKE